MTGFGGILGTEEVHFSVYNNLVRLEESLEIT
jgi:hypothetical protein